MTTTQLEQLAADLATRFEAATGIAVPFIVTQHRQYLPKDAALNAKVDAAPDAVGRADACKYNNEGAVANDLLARILKDQLLRFANIPDWYD